MASSTEYESEIVSLKDELERMRGRDRQLQEELFYVNLDVAKLVNEFGLGIGG